MREEMGESKENRIDLRAPIEARQAHVGVIGLGYVGLPLVLGFATQRFPVTGFDIDADKVEKLKRGESYIQHISASSIQELASKSRFRPTRDFSALAEMDCICIAVPTPIGDNKEPDLSFLENTAREISKYLRRGQLIVLESTTYPGTTEELLLPIFEEGGLVVGEDFCLAYSPEREDPGSSTYPRQKIPKVVGGVTPHCASMAEALYRHVFERVVVVSSTRVAELTKLLENIYRSVNIALVNELKMLTERMGIDIWEVIAAASTKPFGFSPFYPGPGLGGHCIPIDPYYLAWKAKEYDFPTRFIELSGEINTSMPYYVLGRIMDGLNDRGKSLNGAEVLVLGVSYKRDVDDMRESPAIRIIELLQQRGSQVQYHDPYISQFPKLRKSRLELISVELTEEILARMDCVVIVTDHSSYDYEWVVRNAALVIDTRNATAKVTTDRHKIIKA